VRCREVGCRKARAMRRAPQHDLIGKGPARPNLSAPLQHDLITITLRSAPAGGSAHHQPRVVGRRCGSPPHHGKSRLLQALQAHIEVPEPNHRGQPHGGRGMAEVRSSRQVVEPQARSKQLQQIAASLEERRRLCRKATRSGGRWKAASGQAQNHSSAAGRRKASAPRRIRGMVRRPRRSASIRTQGACSSGQAGCADTPSGHGRLQFAANRLDALEAVPLQAVAQLIAEAAVLAGPSCAPGTGQAGALCSSVCQ